MAIAFTANRVASQGTFAAAGTYVVSPATNTVVGETLFLSVALDPTSPVLNGDQFVSVTDNKGNSWLPVRAGTGGAGAGSNVGAAIYLFYCRVNRQILTTDVITIFGAFANTTTRVAVIVDAFSGISALMPRAFNQVVSPNAAIGTSATQSVAITPAASGQLVYGVNAIETNTAVTGDADATNGAWSAIGTVLSNSGTDATSMTLNRQYKIVTAGGAQSWDTTTAVAKTFSAMAAVFAVAAAHVAPSFPEGNPRYPNLAGFEGLPTTTSALSVDRGTGYLYTYIPLPDENGSSYTVTGAEFVTPTELSQHHIAYDMYSVLNLQDASEDDIQTIYLPLRKATLVGGATVSGGTALSALSTVGGDYVTMAGFTQSVDLWFDPTQLSANFLNSRIVNFGIQYVAYRDNSASQGSPSQGFMASYTDTLANAGSGTGGTLGWWISAYYKRDNKYETRWFGETNLFPRTQDRIYSAPGSRPNQNAPWRVQDLVHMANGDESLKFTITGQASQTDLLQTTIFFDYIVMVVQLAPERRYGSGIRTLNNTYTGSGLYGFNYDFTRFQDAFNTSLLMNNNPNGVVGPVNVLLVREAVPASESDYLRLQTGNNAITSLFEALGPSAQLKAFTQPRDTLEADSTFQGFHLGQPGTNFVPIVNGAPYGEIQEFNEYTSSIMIFDENSLGANGPDFGGYTGLAPNNFIQVYNGHNNTAVIQAPGGTQYTYLKVLVRPDPALLTGGSNALTFSIQQPLATPIATATLTASTFNASTNDSGFGWKEIVLTLSAPVTPSAGSVYIVASTTTVASNTPWYWAAAAPDNADGLNGYAGVNGYDYAAVLETALPTPAFVMSTVTLNYSRPVCVATTDKFAKFTFSNGAQYDKIVIMRYDTQGEPILVGTIDAPTNTTVFTDATTPWDIPLGTLSYQVYGIRNADGLVASVSATWNDTSPNPGAAFGLAYNPPLFSTGRPTGGYPALVFTYPVVDQSSVQISWETLNESTMVPLHGVDKFLQLRGAEQRGLRMTATVVVDKFALCDTGLITTYTSLEPAAPAEQLAQGRKSMSPLVYGGDNSPLEPAITSLGARQPWGTNYSLRDLERIGDPITVRFPGGHTRLMNIEIGSMMVTPWSGLYMAEITLTDAAPLDYLASGITVTS